MQFCFFFIGERGLLIEYFHLVLAGGNPDFQPVIEIPGLLLVQFNIKARFVDSVNQDNFARTSILRGDINFVAATSPSNEYPYHYTDNRCDPNKSFHLFPAKFLESFDLLSSKPEKPNHASTTCLMDEQKERMHRLIPQ